MARDLTRLLESLNPDAAERLYGIPAQTLRHRMRVHGITLPEAIAMGKPPRRKRRRKDRVRAHLHDVYGQKMTIRQAAKAYGICEKTLGGRLARGETLEQAVTGGRRPKTFRSHRPQAYGDAPRRILESLITDAQIRQLDSTHWRADGYVGLYRHIVTQTPEGFTLVSIYRPTGEISGAPRRYTREGIPVPVAMLTV